MSGKNTICVLTGLLLAACFSTPNHGECAVAAEYEIKAAFLLNFAKFVDWPASSFADRDSPMVIAVLGSDPFGSVLDNTLRNEKVKGRKLVVKRSNQLSDLKGCHILFVSSSEHSRLGSIIQEVKDQPVLTVGDVAGFADRGGIVNFILRDRKIGFEINTSAADKAGLKISSQLLKLARIV